MEDFIFDDDVDEVGAEVEAFCPKCKADTTHVVISKYEDEIRRVQCNPCGDVHSYRKPKGESDEETPETPTKKKAATAKPTYDQVMAKNKKPPRNYFPDEYFKEMEIVAHPKFGVGYVTENIGSDKIEVTFKDDKRVLVHNRKNLQLPVSMLKPLIPIEKAAKGKKARGKHPKAAARPAAKKPKVAASAAKPKAAKVKTKSPLKKLKRAAAPVRNKAKAKKAAPKKKAAGKKR